MGTDEGAVVRRADDAPSQEVAAGKATRMQLLIGAGDGAPHFAMRRFTMGPGGGMPLHTNDVEHEQYVLGGRARVAVGARTHEVARGSVLLIPGGVPHSYEVIEAPFEFLCLVPNQPDQVKIVGGR